MTDLPQRDANSDDPTRPPYDETDRSVANLERISHWLRWRMTDSSLDTGDLALYELEVREIAALMQLLTALDAATGQTLDEKLAEPAQHERLKTLALRWLNAQRRLLDATTAVLTHRSAGNGH